MPCNQHAGGYPGARDTLRKGFRLQAACAGRPPRRYDCEEEIGQDDQKEIQKSLQKTGCNAQEQEEGYSLAKEESRKTRGPGTSTGRHFPSRLASGSPAPHRPTIAG